MCPPRPVSEHFPILLEGRDLRRGSSPFRFKNMWLKVEGFKDLLKPGGRGTTLMGGLHEEFGVGSAAVLGYKGED
ncbi:hypothetical protein CK203_035061 [Vitis vinifera]|uniref:Uncharacterized protein n=1 Tax=Vitis vinifera TaxID=29760 RepID=A0A438I9X5_VITVI|nr:hypothetical protein CK203_035061 [Vitis vinifera]